MNIQKKNTNLSLEGRLTLGVLAKIVEIFKGFKIQSDKQVDKIIDSEEHVEARSWIRNDSAKQFDAINDSKKMFVDGSDQKAMER